MITNVAILFGLGVKNARIVWELDKFVGFYILKYRKKNTVVKVSKK